MVSAHNSKILRQWPWILIPDAFTPKLFQVCLTSTGLCHAWDKSKVLSFTGYLSTNWAIYPQPQEMKFLIYIWVLSARYLIKYK